MRDTYSCGLDEEHEVLCRFGKTLKQDIEESQYIISKFQREKVEEWPKNFNTSCLGTIQNADTPLITSIYLERQKQEFKARLSTITVKGVSTIQILAAAPANSTKLDLLRGSSELLKGLANLSLDKGIPYIVWRTVAMLHHISTYVLYKLKDDYPELTDEYSDFYEKFVGFFEEYLAEKGKETIRIAKLITNDIIKSYQWDLVGQLSDIMPDRVVASSVEDDPNDKKIILGQIKNVLADKIGNVTPELCEQVYNSARKVKTFNKVVNQVERFAGFTTELKTHEQDILEFIEGQFNHMKALTIFLLIHIIQSNLTSEFSTIRAEDRTLRNYLDRKINEAKNNGSIDFEVILGENQRRFDDLQERSQILSHLVKTSKQTLRELSQSNY
eukprot:TRINITY_DN3503_c0_g2_i1.p1 TRINITY_DN3503_c0_g2~~TRINITY_DN3503_c0_g2_i1.p1  ORF type:complete len:386 (+),score=63.88 TRINITY_DN3503_c0_g2_i1:1705-2862(+)